MELDLDSEHKLKEAFFKVSSAKTKKPDLLDPAGNLRSINTF
jgi:hypothetical protein